MIDSAIIAARLAAAENDSGVFAAAYRKDVPELQKRVAFLEADLARTLSHRQVGDPPRVDSEDPWTKDAERRADQLLQGCREYADEVHAVAAVFDMADALVDALLAVEWITTTARTLGCDVLPAIRRLNPRDRPYTDAIEKAVASTEPLHWLDSQTRTAETRSGRVWPSDDPRRARAGREGRQRRDRDSHRRVARGPEGHRGRGVARRAVSRQADSGRRVEGQDVSDEEFIAPTAFSAETWKAFDELLRKQEQRLYALMSIDFTAPHDPPSSADAMRNLYPQTRSKKEK